MKQFLILSLFISTIANACPDQDSIETVIDVFQYIKTEVEEQINTGRRIVISGHENLTTETCEAVKAFAIYAITKQRLHSPESNNATSIFMIGDEGLINSALVILIKCSSQHVYRSNSAKNEWRPCYALPLVQ